MAHDETENKKVDFSIFMWAIGLIMTVAGVMGWTQMTLSQKVESVNNTNNDLKVEVREIKTDVKWIRETLTTNAQQQSTNNGGAKTSPKR
ncbi:MAG: hypothetical protein NUV80_01015 [Candidatus Berkelbacteria bacterium]|nr:hypothetical protein [Candidatus Berkelbacteria bacterium]